MARSGADAVHGSVVACCEADQHVGSTIAGQGPSTSPSSTGLSLQANGAVAVLGRPSCDMLFHACLVWSSPKWDSFRSDSLSRVGLPSRQPARPAGARAGPATAGRDGGAGPAFSPRHGRKRGRRDAHNVTLRPRWASSVYPPPPAARRRGSSAAHRSDSGLTCRPRWRSPGSC